MTDERVGLPGYAGHRGRRETTNECSTPRTQSIRLWSLASHDSRQRRLSNPQPIMSIMSIMVN